MSFSSTIEVLIHFGEFKNIDLFQQGIYQLRSSIHQGGIFAQPYMTVDDKRKVKDCITQSSKLIDTTYISKAFAVRYCEQEIYLREGCVFRLDLGSYPTLDSDNIFLTIELLFCDLSTVTREDYKQDNLPQYMKRVAVFESRLHNIQKIREYVPCIFDEQHFCSVQLTVHSLLVDFRFHQSEDLTFEGFLKKITNNYQLIQEFKDGYNKQLQHIKDDFAMYYDQMITECIKDDSLRQKLRQLKFSEFKHQESCLSNEIILEIKHLSSQIFVVWYQFIESYNLIVSHLTPLLEHEYLAKIKDRWGESIFQSIETVQDLSQGETQIGKNHQSVANQIRKKPYFRDLEPLNIEDMGLFPEAKQHPIVFKEVVQKSQVERKIVKGKHLLVFVHGYQGNSHDMRLWKNNIAVRYPNHLTLLSVANEDSTERDILQMGERLATEVKKFIREWCPKEDFQKFSFVSHSLGGLIIRAALPHLSKYKDKMYTYLTLATPHLGYSTSSSSIVDTGLWFIRKWKKCICLNQLTLNDHSDYKSTCLYKLSQLEGLGWFNNIVLTSSYQDTYVPFESARMQRSQHSQKQRTFNEMIHNIMGNLQNNHIHRLDVNYQKGKNLDAMIGRAAHIAFLDNSALVKLMVYSFDEYFE